MIPQFVRAVREIQPSAFLMENVPGLAVGERIAYWTAVLRQFEELGFTVSLRLAVISALELI